MSFLSDCDALVVDIRANGGGSAQMVQLLCSYFFAERTHLNSIHSRGDAHVKEFWTLDELASPRLADVPVFVLTSGFTFSAAEEFAYNLKSRGRAVIVGETTGGGAHPGETVPLGERFHAFVATERSVNPVTGTNWEGTGVAPDVACPAAEARERALVLAREAADERRAAREAAWEAALADLRARLDEAHAHLDALATLGRLALEADRTALALVLAAFAVDAFPDGAPAHVLRARALERSGDTAAAISDYGRALELEPGNPRWRAELERLKGGG
jgi:tetratricopeptide (TPR) repeat protein